MRIRNGSGFTDQMYIDAGAEIVASKTTVFNQADIIVTIGSALSSIDPTKLKKQYRTALLIISLLTAVGSGLR